MKRIGRVFILLALMLPARPAAAHPVPFSYLDLQLRNGSIDVSLTVHIFDLAHDLQITPIERLLDPAFIAEREAAIRALFGPRMEFKADGRVLSPEWLKPEI